MNANEELQPTRYFQLARLPQRPRDFGDEDPRCWDLRPQLRVCGDVTCVGAVSRSDRSKRSHRTHACAHVFHCAHVSELQLAESGTTVLQICSTGEQRKPYDPQKLCSCMYRQAVRLFPQQYVGYSLGRPRPIQPMYLFTMQSPGALKQKGACPWTMGCLSHSALGILPILSK